jgi:hypothetical protein
LLIGYLFACRDILAKSLGFGQLNFGKELRNSVTCVAAHALRGVMDQPSRLSRHLWRWRAFSRDALARG